MNLEQALTEYRRCGLSKQTVIHDACRDCPLFVKVLDGQRFDWTVCDLLTEMETPGHVVAEAEQCLERR